jgi:hypothetical protein
MINFPYQIARAEAWLTRTLYQTRLPRIVSRQIVSSRNIDLDVFAYSGETALPEQIASIRAFLRYAGRPNRFVVVSDGTYTPRSIELLQRVDPVVEVRPCPQPPPELSVEKLRVYLSTHPTGKQLALIMSLPMNRPALYVDSDVLFFPGARDLTVQITNRGAPAYYLPDCEFSGDTRLLRSAAEKQQPVNTGALLLFDKLDWSLSIERFLQLDADPIFFTNQTMTHLTMHANAARPLDSGKYVLRRDDEFMYRDLYAGNAVALRHYVTPVRHKFWTRLARRHG